MNTQDLDHLLRQFNARREASLLFSPARASRASRLMTFALSCVAVLGAAGRFCMGQTTAEAERAWRIADPLVMAIYRGVAFMAQYDYDAAVKACEEAVRLEPKSVEAPLNLAIALFNRAGKSDIERSAKLLDEVPR